MSNHLEIGFGPLELEALAGAARAAAEEHLRSCSRCAQEFRDSAGALELLARDLPPEEPDPALWRRLEHSIREGRLAPFTARVARILDVSLELAGQLLDAIDDAARWVPGPAVGVTLLHIEGGPRVAGAVAGFVRVEPGASFPQHTHVGEETVLVLQGRYASDSGQQARRGELQMKAGSTHSVAALEGPPLVYLSVVDDEGVVLADGEVIRAGDPRL
jgi:putative transcriptional regulator